MNRIYAEELMDQRVPLPVDEPSASPASATPPLPATVPAGPVDVGDLQEKIIEVLRTCYDPEIPVNIYELGLIYNIDVQETGDVTIRMTLTSPMCPVAGTLPPEVQFKVQGVAGVKSAKVDLVWDPPWNQDMMSEAARVQLGFF
jgi:FeS assembly SUF system protein